MEDSTEMRLMRWGGRGKVFMVNIKGDATKEDVVYDVEKEEWEYMPVGMTKGWKGLCSCHRQGSDVFGGGS